MTEGTNHQVRRGDTMITIARRHGYRSIDPIWNHPNNAELRKARPNPFVLAQGDSVFIPAKELGDHPCQTDRRHVFRVRAMTQWLDQVLVDHANRPFAGKRYEVTVAGKVFQGETGGDGRVRHEIPLDAKQAALKLWTDDTPEGCITWNLQLGHLEPVETTYGLKGHLANLGYDCGPLDDTASEQLEQALLAFQRDHKLSETGQSDDATRTKLRALFAYPLESSP